MSNIEEAVRLVKERLNSQPSEITDCEACGSEDSMELRRSSLTDGFYADDQALKCMNCWHVRTHGIPFDDPEQFHKEKDLRGKRTIDFADLDTEEYDRAEQLEKLGYTARAKDISE